MEALVRTAQRLVAPHQVVLGLDTAPAVLAARLRAARIVPTAATVAAYRRMVLGADALATRVSGVVLPPDAVVPAIRARVRTVLGVRADTGREALGRGTVTRGLDGLSARLHEWRGQGVSFAVWHAGPGAELPALRADAHAAARFALACQDARLVPMVRIGTGTDPATQVAALLTFLDQLDELDVPRAGVVVVTQAVRAALDVLPTDLGGIATTRVPGTDRRHLGLMVGADATGPALSAWRGADVPAGRRVLHRRLAALCAPVPALAVGC